MLVDLLFRFVQLAPLECQYYWGDWDVTKRARRGVPCEPLTISQERVMNPTTWRILPRIGRLMPSHHITSYHIHHVQRYHYEMSISTPNSAIVPRLVENPIVCDATQNVTFLELWWNMTLIYPLIRCDTYIHKNQSTIYKHYLITKMVFIM